MSGPPLCNRKTPYPVSSLIGRILLYVASPTLIPLVRLSFLRFLWVSQDNRLLFPAPVSPLVVFLPLATVHV